MSDDSRARVEELWRHRPRDGFSRISLLLLGTATGFAWLAGDLQLDRFFAQGRWSNLRRFAFEILPYPLQQRWMGKDGIGAEGTDGGLWPALMTWGVEQMDTALQATWITLLMSVVAIVAAGLWATFSGLASSRRIVSANPYAPPQISQPIGKSPFNELAFRKPWWLVRGSARGTALLMRAVPEYVAAFFFVALIGPSAWAVVLALAMHNAGILSRLGAESVDNLNPRRGEALRGLGASRLQIIWAQTIPEVSGRWLLYFFYRWETCVREATVLGMLGVASLGYWIQDARARQHLDEMMVLILCGGLLVLCGDWLSTWVREKLRQSVG